jgi:hypothetical protein
MTKYRKKPIVIEAIRYLGGNYWGADHKPQWLLAAFDSDLIYEDIMDKYCVIIVKTGMRLLQGDWLICGIKGELYPCKDEIFKMNYKMVEDKNNIETIAALEEE